jgi:hypothetical protein
LGYASNLHLTCVFDPSVGDILVYTNAVLAGDFTGITDPLSSVGSQFAYIGRSLYTADAYLNWSLQELRIYNGVLSPAEIEASDALGPNTILNTASPTFSASQISGGNLTLSWPLASAGFTLMYSSNLTGPWSPISAASPQIINGQWQATVPLSGGNEFFRLEK